ncbi:hypothetical protein Q4595_18245, partial [Wenyingzhuangia sp. 1_MG-2023]|nr:hypothetical protein [Wenyingzhuangia sp. 1_MG-2023]
GCTKHISRVPQVDCNAATKHEIPAGNDHFGRFTIKTYSLPIVPIYSQRLQSGMASASHLSTANRDTSDQCQGYPDRHIVYNWLPLGHDQWNICDMSHK